MYHKVEVLLWNMTGDDECDQYSLEQNGFKHENTLCNVIGIKKTDWY